MQSFAAEQSFALLTRACKAGRQMLVPAAAAHLVAVLHHELLLVLHLLTMKPTEMPAMRSCCACTGGCMGQAHVSEAPLIEDDRGV